uniref:TonB-dependent copper receptor n=1 Tax=uncultured Acinetobacter sp. TaxID=165433 RepID=UPI0026052163|nr:TonB-dependent copper receptor [uncultured Acinetobacter sp.]
MKNFETQPLVVAMTLICLSAVQLSHAEALDTEKTQTHDHQHAVTPTKNSPVMLSPIVVTAQQGNQANGLILETDAKQTIQPMPASDGAAYLNSIMGFNSVKNGGTNGDVTFRGMYGSRIKMLTDGTENLGACPNRMDAPTAYISPESFDKITVIKGPQTVQYATPGSAATVLFEREAPTFDKDKPYLGEASIMLGSFGRIDHNVEVAVGNDTVYARLNANRSKSDDYQDGDGTTIHSNWERWSSDLALGWTPDADTWLELKAGVGDGESAYAGRSMDGSQFKRESLGLHAEKRNISDVISKIEAQVDYSFNDHVMDNYSLRDAPMTTMMGMSVPNEMSMRVTRRTLNSRVAMTSEWDQFSLITGLDSQRNKHAGDMKSSAMLSMNMPLEEDLRFQSYGAFGELNYQLNPQNKVVTGLRFDQVTVDSVENDQQRKDTLPSAFIRLENNQDNGLNSYIGVGHVQRSPDYWELYSTSTSYGNGTTDMMGNSSYLMVDNLNNLETEKTTQLDLGFEHQSGKYKSWASAYAGVINDFILVRYNGNTRPLAENVDATIAGGELGVGYNFTDRLQTDLSAMYAWGENITDNTPLPQIAPLEGRFNLRYVTNQYSLGLLWRVVAKQGRISVGEGNIVGYDMQESDAFNTLSINANYQINPAIGLAFGIDNVLNENYTEHLNKAGASVFGYASNEQFNQMGRNYWARVSMKF